MQMRHGHQRIPPLFPQVRAYHGGYIYENSLLSSHFSPVSPLYSLVTLFSYYAQNRVHYGSTEKTVDAAAADRSATVPTAHPFTSATVAPTSGT